MAKPPRYHGCMLELTPANAEAYLREHRRIPQGLVRVTELTEGVSNAVLRVETAAGKFVLKQSRPRLRTEQAWFSDLSRVWRERDTMMLLRPLLPAGTVPEVLWSDDKNYAFAMRHAPEPFRNWRTMLLAGEVDLKLGEEAGRLLGTIHEKTARNAKKLEPFADRTVFEQLRIDPFYVRISERLPDMAELVGALIARCRTVRLGLCHGDFSPKNLLVHGGGQAPSRQPFPPETEGEGAFVLVDYETAHWGDVTFDLGFLLSHLLLKAIYRFAERERYFELTRAFWRGYGETVTFAPLAELLPPGIGHTAGCIVARIDGTSPAPYLTDEMKRDLARNLGRRLLRERPGEWEKVLKICSTV